MVALSRINQPLSELSASLQCSRKEVSGTFFYPGLSERESFEKPKSRPKKPWHPCSRYEGRTGERHRIFRSSELHDAQPSCDATAGARCVYAGSSRVVIRPARLGSVGSAPSRRNIILDTRYRGRVLERYASIPLLLPPLPFSPTNC